MKSEESLTLSYDEANYPKGERSYDYYLRRMKEDRALKQQVGGEHYKGCKIQPVEYIHATGLDYLEGNVIKYITRHRTKGEGRKDIEKAIHFAQLILEMESDN